MVMQRVKWIVVSLIAVSMLSACAPAPALPPVARPRPRCWWRKPSWLTSCRMWRATASRWTR